jgi:hypothetical protein
MLELGGCLEPAPYGLYQGLKREGKSPVKGHLLVAGTL